MKTYYVTKITVQYFYKIMALFHFVFEENLIANTFVKQILDI